MKTLGSLLTSILILGILTAIVWGSIWGIKFLFGQYYLLGSELASSMIIITALLLICSFILAASIRFNRVKNDRQVHPEKAYLYTEFINYYIEIRNSISTQGKINYRFRSDMSLWAGKEVLKAYLLLNQYIDELNPDNPKILEQAEKVIFEMRKELGYNNYGFKTGDLDKIIFPNKGESTKQVQSANIQTS